MLDVKKYVYSYTTWAWAAGQPPAGGVFAARDIMNYLRNLSNNKIITLNVIQEENYSLSNEGEIDDVDGSGTYRFAMPNLRRTRFNHDAEALLNYLKTPILYPDTMRGSYYKGKYLLFSSCFTYSPLHSSIRIYWEGIPIAPNTQVWYGIHFSSSFMWFIRADNGQAYHFTLQYHRGIYKTFSLGYLKQQ